MWSDSELKAVGIHAYGEICPGDIRFREEIRKICQGNTCHQYGRTWACPPAVGSVAQCRERCLGFSHALVFNGVYTLEDSFDHEGMMEGHRAFKELCDRLYELVRERCPRFQLLSNEGCIRCKSCTYPVGECRMPEKLFPSLEGYGILVTELAEQAGIAYNNGRNTVTYFGMLLY